MVQLLKLEMEGFGKFDSQKTIDFVEGVNFITGLNEAGKSTILEAITAAIFKYTKSQIQPFLCWKNQDTCSTSLTYKITSGETFRITTDYKSGKRRLLKIDKGKVKEVSSVEKNIDPYLKAHFGFDDRKVFETTAFIRQSQMVILEDTSVRNRIKDMIEEVFAGRSEASATKALAKIRKISKDFEKQIDALKDDQSDLQEILETAQATKKKVVSDSILFEKTTRELEEKSKRFNKLIEWQESFEDKEKLNQEKGNLEDKIEKIDRVISTVRENFRKKETINVKLEDYSGYSTLGDFETLKQSIRNLEIDEGSLTTLQKTGCTQKVIEIKYNRRYVALFAAGIVLCIIIVGIPLVVYSYKRLKIKVEKEVIDEEKKSQMGELEERIQSSTKRISGMGAGIKGFNIKTFPDSYDRYAQLVEESKRISLSSREIVCSELEHDEIEENENENLKKIEAKKTSYLNRLAITENSLEKYKLLSLGQTELEELQELAPLIDRLKYTKTELKTSIKTTTDLVDDPDDIREKLDSIEEDKLSLLKKVEELELAAEFLALAQNEVQQKFTPAIETNSKPLLIKITNEKYSDLRIQEETMGIEVKAPEIDSYVDVSLLSQGAKDQLYFTLRTVMSDLLSGETNIPLILDDPFHNFDAPRLDRTIDTVRQISKTKQIILISHRPYHKEFEGFCDKVVEL